MDELVRKANARARSNPAALRATAAIAYGGATRIRALSRRDMCALTHRRALGAFARTGYARRACACGDAACPVYIESKRSRVTCGAVGCRRRVALGLFHGCSGVTKTLVGASGAHYRLLLPVCDNPVCLQQATADVEGALRRNGLP